MDVLVERCAGLDVHRDSVVATVRVPGTRRGSRRTETRTYATTIAGLERMSDWLVGEHRVTLVGMEATGVYWKPVFAVLESRVECWLLNAQHLHNVPGRKTDVADSVWIAQLVEHGLVRPSFVPPPMVRDLRDLTRLRTALTQERSRTIQRLEKVQQDAGIKLTSVASQAYSKTARAILSALLSGVSDPIELAGLAKGRLRSKTDRLAEALANRFRVVHHGPLVAQLLAHLDSVDEQLAALDDKIAAFVAPIADLVELICTIPGVAANTAHVLLAECGWDMSVFPTAGHLASWAGICPGNNASGGKRFSGATRPGSKWLRKSLTQAAQAAARGKGTYLAAHHAQIRGRRGHAKAIGATRHDILVAYWHIVRDRVPFRELGPDWIARRFSVERRTNRLVRQLEALGVKVTVEPEAA
jgi:transposase